MSDFKDSPASEPLATGGKATTRERILQAALTCFSNKGYHQTTTDEIVTESGLGKGTLYRYFKSKQDLFISLVEWFMVGFSQEIFHALTDGMSAADKIRTIMMISVESSEQLIPFFKVWLDFWAQTSDDEQLLHIFDNMIVEFQNQLSAIIEEGVADGEFHPVDAPRLSLALFGMVDSLFLYKTLLGDKVDMHGSAKAALDVVLKGLTCVNEQ